MVDIAPVKMVIGGMVYESLRHCFTHIIDERNPMESRMQWRSAEVKKQS